MFSVRDRLAGVPVATRRSGNDSGRGNYVSSSMLSAVMQAAMELALEQRTSVRTCIAGVSALFDLSRGTTVLGGYGKSQHLRGSGLYGDTTTRPRMRSRSDQAIPAAINTPDEIGLNSGC
jgi:hypothetical protein